MTREEFENLKVGDRIYLASCDNWGTVEIIALPQIGVRWVKTHNRDQPEIGPWGHFYEGIGYYVAKNEKEELIIRIKHNTDGLDE
jgi:hypothetical protein